MNRLSHILAAFALAGCASYGGGGLRPGEARVEDVLRAMGPPAMRWQLPDRTLQLSYPRGPAGVHSYMVHVGADGRLARIENVMTVEAFSKVRPGMTKDEVLMILGPPEPAWTAHFPARDELVWEWRYCDDWSEAARFDVLFDARTGTVRSTMGMTEAQRGLCEEDMRCICGR